MKINKNALQWIFKLVIGVVLVIAIYKHVYSDHSFFKAFLEAKTLNIFWAFIFLFINISLQLIRWRFVLKHAYPEIEDSIIAKSLFFGITLGLASPGNIGELGRGIYFKKYDRWLITGLTMVDKFSGVLVMSLIGLVSVYLIVLMKLSLSLLSTIFLSLLVILVVTVSLTVVLNPQWIVSLSHQIPGASRFREKIIQLTGSLAYFNRYSMTKLLGINLIWIGGIIIQFYILLTAFTAIPFFQFFLAVTAMYFTKILLPLSIADLGIREGLAVFYFSLFGAEQQAVFNSSLLILVFNIVIPAIIGSYFLFRLRLVRNGHRTSEQEEVKAKRV